MSAQEDAHQVLDGFHRLCDHYNGNGFSDLIGNPALIDIFHDIAKDSLKLIKYLRSCEDVEATRMYHVFISKILIRISHIKHNGRIETISERDEHIHKVMSDFNRKAIA